MMYQASKGYETISLMSVQDNNVRLKIRQSRSPSLQAALESALTCNHFGWPLDIETGYGRTFPGNVRRVEETKEPPVNCEGDAQMSIRVEMRKNGTIVTRGKKNQSKQQGDKPRSASRGQGRRRSQ